MSRMSFNWEFLCSAWVTEVWYAVWKQVNIYKGHLHTWPLQNSHTHLYCILHIVQSLNQAFPTPPHHPLVCLQHATQRSYRHLVLEGHADPPHDTIDARRAETLHSLSSTTFGFYIPPPISALPLQKQWQLLEEAAGLALSYTAPTYRVMFSIASPPWIIHARNLKFPCKAVLRSSACLCVSLARHPGGERTLPWSPSISDPAAHADVTPL